MTVNRKLYICLFINIGYRTYTSIENFVREVSSVKPKMIVSVHLLHFHNCGSAVEYRNLCNKFVLLLGKFIELLKL